MLGFFVFVALLTTTSGAYGKSADIIWYNGTILTMNDRQPSAGGIAVAEGRIIAVGSQSDVLKLKKASTQLVDLGGRTMLPGFVDAHGHVSMVGLQADSANLLPPPDGDNASIKDIQATLLRFMKSSANPRKYGVVVGFGYDDSQLRERRHPTRVELDAVSEDVPIVIMHQSGHIGVLNSAALRKAGLNEKSRAPAGGVIQRLSGSKVPNGVLEENAFFAAMAKVMPRLTDEQNIETLRAGEKLYIQYGYTTIQDGRSSPEQVATAILASKRQRLLADVVSYPDVLLPGVEDLMKPPYYHSSRESPSYVGRFRIGGVKLTLDGSPQGKTAWLSQPYFRVPAGMKPDYAGYGVVSDKVVQEAFEKSLRNRWQILTHVNGDRAIDQMLQGLSAAEKKYPGVDVRPVLIHGQTLRQDQVARLKDLRVIPSLFPMHTFYWGDWYRESVLGPERAENISPTGWVLKEGLIFTTHHDAPVVFPDSIRVLAATVNRTTRSGRVLGPEHRVSPEVALKAMTLWPAFQHFEEKNKGSLEVGKLADLVVLSDNPLTVPKEKLIDIKVLETIKEGKTIYKKEETVLN